VPTEYDYIDIIGSNHENFRNLTEKKINAYYHLQELKTLKNLLLKINFNDYDNVIDLGTSYGAWCSDYKQLGFRTVTGIEISPERAKIAEKRGYDKVHVCNASKMPFEDSSRNCIVSNDVLVHVINDSDKLKIFKEVKRVLKKNGVFIFGFANAFGNGFKSDTTVEYCRFNTTKTITGLIKESGLKIEYVVPSYFTIPRIAASPIVASFSTKIIFPLLDLLLSKMKDLNHSKVNYVVTRKD